MPNQIPLEKYHSKSLRRIAVDQIEGQLLVLKRDRPHSGINAQDSTITLNKEIHGSANP